MATPNTPNKRNPQQNDEFLSIMDLLVLCWNKWYWFIISTALALALAILYLLSTPPTYTRTASMLIKEDRKGRSLSDAAGVFSNFDIFQTNTNADNEIFFLESPMTMTEVVKRLHLDVNYHADGRFYDPVLYGTANPYTVRFLDLADEEFAAFKIESEKPDGSLVLKEFRRGKEKFSECLTAIPTDTLATPAGRIVIEPNPDCLEKPEDAILVTRVGYNAVALGCVSRLSVELAEERSSVVMLTYVDNSIRRAEDILNTLMAVYNESWLKDKNQIAVNTSRFINERLEVIERELSTVDQDISAYKSENLLPDVEAAAGMYMDRSNTATMQIIDTETKISLARYVKNYLNSMEDGALLPADTGIDSPGIEKQISEYNTLQLRRDALVAGSSASNPLVVDVDKNLASMRTAIMASVDNHIKTLETVLASIKKTERETSSKIAEAPSQGQYLMSVQRQQKVKEALYMFLLQKREENELSVAFTPYNTRLVTPPSGKMSPTAPSSMKVMLIALVIGLLIPVVIIFMMETLNTRVRGRKDLEDMTLPLAGEIPQVGKPSKLPIRPWLRKNSTEANRKMVKQKILVRPEGRDVVNEAFRVLRTNIEFMCGERGKGAEVLAMTSFNPSSGKSFVTMNLAASLVLKGRKVLVIDGDLRKVSASASVGSPKAGLAQYLTKGGAPEIAETPGELTKAKKDAIYAALSGIIKEVPEVPGLDLLPAGSIPPNPTELLTNPKLGDVVGVLRERYEYIFVDCPPVEIVADTQIINRLVDRTLFVVRAGLLEKVMLPELQKAYDEGKYANLTMVLNGTSDTVVRYGYGYRYGYRYGGGRLYKQVNY